MDRIDRILLRTFVGTALGCALTFLVLMLTESKSVLAWLGLVLWVLAVTGGGIVAARTECRDCCSALLDEVEQGQQSVDPWAIQRDLMVASEQALPSEPTLSKGSILYAALMAEELGETFEALHCAVLRSQQGQSMAIGMPSLLACLFEQSMSLDSFAKKVRGILTAFGDFEIPLEQTDAVAIFDGTTDVAVTNCGFALASGLPAAEGYLEVGTSNLSKANRTGKIDKTADGKWIKGPHFFKPDLARVLAEAQCGVSPDADGPDSEGFHGARPWNGFAQ